MDSIDDVYLVCSNLVMNHPISGFRIRPRFEHTVARAPEVVRTCIAEASAASDTEFEVKSMAGMIVIHIAETERHRWSPRLQLSLDEADDGGTHIVGVYGPEHEVWAMFIYGYLVTGLLGTFSGIYGCAQLFLGQPPWALWICGSMAVVAGVLYLVAQLGQKLGAWQTFELHQVYQDALERPAPDLVGSR